MGTKQKGTVATQPVNSYARRCIRDWLLKPIEVTKIGDNGETVETIPLLFKNM